MQTDHFTFDKPETVGEGRMSVLFKRRIYGTEDQQKKSRSPFGRIL